MRTQPIRTKTLVFQGYNPKVKSRHSSKFYRLIQRHREIYITFGKIGAIGQTIKKVFATHGAASDFFYRKLFEKIAKGYYAA